MVADSFFSSLEPFTDFNQVVAAEVYHPLPKGWILGLTDVVGSTKAIEAGQYKRVNMAGASIITALMNALGDAPFPYVFGGDGASFAIPPDVVETAREVMSATSAWVRDDLDLELRTALVPVSDIRAAGHDVLIARFAASGDVGYAMFSGGGLAWAETAMKAGAFDVEPAPPGTKPDLEGLSCRWAPIKAQKGDIISLLVTPAPNDGDSVQAEAFRDVILKLLAIIANISREAHPVPESGPTFSWTSSGIKLETLAPESTPPLKKPWWKVVLIHMASWLLFKTNLKFRGFDPEHYRRTVAINSDFRKFDDGLRMTIDCDRKTANMIKAVLAKAREDKIAHYGLHRQSAALMTCIVPSPKTDDHVHFLDGADGGYAKAALALKAQIAGEK